MAAAAEKEQGEISKSTLMIKNLPSRCGPDEVQKTVDAFGYHDTYDFFYLPVRHPFGKAQNFGYAFINFLEVDVAERFKVAVQEGGLKVRSKTVSVAPAHIQGVTSLRQHFQDTVVLKNPTAPYFADEEGARAGPIDRTPLTRPKPPQAAVAGRVSSNFASSGNHQGSSSAINALPLPMSITIPLAAPMTVDIDPNRFWNVNDGAAAEA
eukprot:TRINITY_DN10586_c0_g1_i2.p1 TRINITY_DN10586_c0_g1~~TRINITY_DN10586_c0_g1_i2.p1  ORF type:complete len:209 (-),score=44.95 TRINITY_DN10586_c0_g1_i2:510-1136(-)